MSRLLRRPPVLIVSAPRSGEGKTTVALGLMAAFARRGLEVQGFKAGPDYLDTGYQRLATGRPGRNLDLWMMGQGPVLEALEGLVGQADLVIIEGAMGLFDGHREGTVPVSTADLAALLDAPVILVVDARGAAASIGAMVMGFRHYDERVHLLGVVLNHWNPHRARTAVEDALARAGVEVLGVLPPCGEVSLPSRHLGLVEAREISGRARETVGRLADLMETALDLDRLLEAARATVPLGTREERHDEHLAAGTPTAGGPRTGFDPVLYPRVAVALDDAFSFYYQENLEALERAGAEIVYFSPCQMATLPECDGLYLGGGYPQLHLAEIAGNRSFLEELRRAVLGGLPTYAECGGLMLLCRAVVGTDGSSTSLAAAIPATVYMTDRPQALGYRQASLACDCLIGEAGTVLRGHEFHYSRCESQAAWTCGFNPAYLIDGRPEGFARGNLFASYIHLHFAGCPGVVESWLDKCRKYRSDRETEICVLLGHGSRSTEAANEFLRLVTLVQERLDRRVIAAFMDYCSPRLEEAVLQAVGMGARRVTVVPCFLFSGNHVRRDIPATLERLARAHPGTDLRLGQPLGPDPRLAEIIADRMFDAG